MVVVVLLLGPLLAGVVRPLGMAGEDGVGRLDEHAPGGADSVVHLVHEAVGDGRGQHAEAQAVRGDDAGLEEIKMLR